MPVIVGSDGSGMGQSIEGHSIMAQEDVYFQFPIRALNMGKKIDKVTEDEADDRFRDILGYCLVDYGTKNSGKAGREHANKVASDFIQNKGITYTYNPKKRLTVPLQAAVFFAADRLGVVWSAGTEVNLSSKYDSYRTISDLLGGNMQVRLRHDLFWDLKERKLDWREWSILCGVYAMVANRPMVKLSYATLNALALGYNGRNSIPNETFDLLRLTDRQTQTTVDRLKSRGFFSKASPNFRHNYYSMKSHEELENMLAHKEAKKVIKANETKAAEQTKRIRDRIAEMVEQEQKAKSRSAPADVARK
jgi:hypothetical protein